MSDSNVNKVIEEFSHLPVGDKEYVVGFITKQVVDVKREMFAERVREAKESLQKGFAKTGTIRELMEDLDRD